MKIRSLTDAVQTFSSSKVKEKSEKEGFSRFMQQHQNSEQKEDETVEVTDETVEKAIDEFAHDEQALSAGITAHATGHGPGLKIILKDGSGGVLRQMTGEEFIKLRDAVHNIAHKSGKILDQKL